MSSSRFFSGAVDGLLVVVVAVAVVCCWPSFMLEFSSVPLESDSIEMGVSLSSTLEVEPPPDGVVSSRPPSDLLVLDVGALVVLAASLVAARWPMAVVEAGVVDVAGCCCLVVPITLSIITF